MANGNATDSIDLLMILIGVGSMARRYRRSDIELQDCIEKPFSDF